MAQHLTVLGLFLCPSLSPLMSKTRNAIVAGSAAGTATAALSSGAIGVAMGGSAFKIPVLGQVLAVGTVAALGAAALTGNKTAKKHLAVVAVGTLFL